MFRLFPVFALFTLAAFAADPSGTWKGSMQGPTGMVDGVYTFKVDGNKLTGTMAAGPIATTEISDGKIEGDNLSFSVAASVNGNDFRIECKGKIGDGELKLTLYLPHLDQTFEMTAKKSS